MGPHIPPNPRPTCRACLRGEHTTDCPRRTTPHKHLDQGLLPRCPPLYTAVHSALLLLILRSKHGARSCSTAGGGQIIPPPTWPQPQPAVNPATTHKIGFPTC